MYTLSAFGLDDIGCVCFLKINFRVKKHLDLSQIFDGKIKNLVLAKIKIKLIPNIFIFEAN
jgi:hypothetical protein